MISLPTEFVSTKYPGYFWNTKEEKLYSIKSGVLKPLVYRGPCRWNYFQSCYSVSVDGTKRSLYTDYLKKLKPKTETFPVWKQVELL